MSDNVIDINKMAGSLKHWVGFEFICTVGGFCYLIFLANQGPLNETPVAWVMLFLSARAVFLFRVLIHTIVVPASTIDLFSEEE